MSSLRRSPTLETLAAFVIVYILQRLTALAGLAAVLFVLSAPVSIAPWTVVTSVYAHANLAHLFGNALALVIVGPLVARRTTRLRFHLFFVSTGAIAGIAEVWFGGLVGARAVLGASGAVFALMGYLLAGNRVSAALFDRIEVSPRMQLVLFVGLAVVVTIATWGPGIALVAHFTGLVLGLIAGRLGLLSVTNRNRRYK
ncbi:rhomboid family protein/intramembrane serine protease [Halalkaliarchaeum desulfuricum]|uniref:Rhomboid family protein/intramembrane serine protease n=1 Tax=Halalkaliarchaeum desulfuricum TaxID=2055893 RepID=A0A343TH53_9EURY|nr:rhomboid family intramembrane serine protease [Halalkaliarchaeum desulfuricum]AUX08425.1 rhomboid family protein/intramembrane serine protease [Halalkaliarchaeum desulfuricum]